MMLTLLIVHCKAWWCKAEIRLDEVSGLYFWGDELRYEGGSSFRLTCKKCGRSRNYKVRDVIVLRGGDAIR